jgi:hypothetical protein
MTAQIEHEVQLGYDSLSEDELLLLQQVRQRELVRVAQNAFSLFSAMTSPLLGDLLLFDVFVDGLLDAPTGRPSMPTGEDVPAATLKRQVRGVLGALTHRLSMPSLRFIYEIEVFSSGRFVITSSLLVARDNVALPLFSWSSGVYSDAISGAAVEEALVEACQELRNKVPSALEILESATAS